TDHYAIYNQTRVHLIFETHRIVQGRLIILALIGEWGAFTNHQTTVELTKDLIGIFERYLWSNTYWCYTSDIKKMPYVRALNRAYPQTTGGRLISYHYDYDSGKISVEYIPSGLESLIYHPKAAHLNEKKIIVTGTIDYQTDIHSYSGADSGIVSVVTAQGDEAITVTIG